MLALHSLSLKKYSYANRTWVATGHAAYMLNHSIYLADVSKSTMNYDINKHNKSNLNKIIF